jgi:signal transduction histidine kinase
MEAYRAEIESLLDLSSDEQLAEVWQQVYPLPIDPARELPDRRGIIVDLADFVGALTPSVDGMESVQLCRLVERYAAYQSRQEVDPTDNKSFEITDQTRALRKAQGRPERPVADHVAGPARASELLRHEIKERRHAEELLLKEQRYLRYLLDLKDRDRQMVSYEIHDGFAQQLAAAIMQLEAFGQLAERSDNKVWKTFETGLQCLHDCMREARQLINALRPSVLDEKGVVAAIQDLITQNTNQDEPRLVRNDLAAGRDEPRLVRNDPAARRYEPQIDFVHHLEGERLAPPLENVIFRIVQECLTNARRYSQSDRLLVEVTQRDNYVRIEVQDWGIGFDPRRVGAGHFGLEGIQERARLFGGSATIKSALGTGTRIVVQLPLMEDVGAVNARNGSGTKGKRRNEKDKRKRKPAETATEMTK